ncbi:MAG: phosphopantetheine-binding protein [Chthoniobacteraceae bacterium]
MNTAPSEGIERRNEITRAVRRCNPAAIEAALRFQETRSPADVEPVIHGLIAREMPDENAVDLSTVAGTTRLIEDLGLDSLGLMEIVMAAEEVFGISIDNQELRSISTLDELNHFVGAKLAEAK